MKFNTSPNKDRNLLLFLAFFFVLFTQVVMVLGLVSLIMFYLN